MTGWPFAISNHSATFVAIVSNHDSDQRAARVFVFVDIIPAHRHADVEIEAARRLSHRALEQHAGYAVTERNANGLVPGWKAPAIDVEVAARGHRSQCQIVFDHTDMLAWLLRPRSSAVQHGDKECTDHRQPRSSQYSLSHRSVVGVF